MTALESKPATTSPKARALLSSALLLSALAWGAGAALAQSSGNGPIRLTPPSVNDDRSAPQDPAQPPQPGAPFPSATPQPTAPEINAATPRRGIQIQTLAEPSIETLGPLSDETGGLGYDLWAGSQRGIVLGLMRRLPDQLESYEGRDLAYRLLLTDAAPPEGGAEHENAELLLTRAALLQGLGQSGGLLRLLEVAPSDIVNAQLARPQVEAQLLVGDYGEACANTRAHADFSDSPEFWQKSLIFCQVFGGEIAAAQLSLQLMAELPGETSGTFLAMGQRMLDGFGEVPRTISPSAPDLAMADLLGEPLPDGFLPLDAPGFAKAALRLSGLSPEERARAAEVAAAQRLIGASSLTRAYKEIPFSQPQLEAALTLAASQPPAVGRALLYQAARRTESPAAAAEIMINAFESAENDGLYQAVVAAFEGPLVRLGAQPDLAWFAATAGRALYSLGKHEQAGAWLDVARQEAVTSPQAQASVTALWPYAMLAGDSAADWDGSLMAWGLARNEAEPQVESMKQQLATSFRALGVSERLDVGLGAGASFSGPVTPDTTKLIALRDASEAGRRGETLLLTFIALGPQGTRAVHPLTQEAILQALKRVGYDAEARALAIEMALKAGI